MNEPVRFRSPERSRRPAGKLRDGTAGRSNDPERTQANILAVAMEMFAEKGLDGARIDEIAAATRTSKRMIYYYFGSKEGLYLAALEAGYSAMRRTEAELHLDDLDPDAALRRLVEFTFDHHRQGEPYIRLVMAENMQRGQYLARSRVIRELNVPAISTLESLCARGVSEGRFRAGLDAVDLHASISALCFFNVANRHTFGLIFNRDHADPAVVAARRESIVQMVLRFVKA